MHYQFPIIRHLDDILPAIEGRDEFQVMKREHALIADYLVSYIDTFPDPNDAPNDLTKKWWAIRRECRGLLFDVNTKKLISRRYHKFFNVNERPETASAMINLDANHVVMDKLDGSMVSAFVTDSSPEKVKWDAYTKKFHNDVFWGSMMGVTDCANGAKEFIKASNFDYNGFALATIKQGYTPIFEWTSPRFPIVVKYNQENLILTGLRHMESGRYLNVHDMTAWAERYNIPVVHVWDSVTNIDSFLAKSVEETNIEGYVLRWDDGHMTKVKNDWYRHIHKTKERLVFEKDVIKIILEGTLDDIYGDLTEYDQNRISKYESGLKLGINEAVDYVRNFVDNAKKACENIDAKDRQKKFATEFAPDVNPLLTGVAYRVFSGGNAYDEVCKLILSNTGSSTRVERVRELIKTKW